jgi:hypothetical protein
VSVRFLTQLREKSKLREQMDSSRTSECNGRVQTVCVRHDDLNSLGLWGMDWPDCLRDQAAMYRKLAEEADDPVVKTELLGLASVCEEIANNIEDHLTGG